MSCKELTETEIRRALGVAVLGGSATLRHLLDLWGVPSEVGLVREGVAKLRRFEVRLVFDHTHPPTLALLEKHPLWGSKREDLPGTAPEFWRFGALEPWARPGDDVPVDFFLGARFAGPLDPEPRMMLPPGATPLPTSPTVMAEPPVMFTFS